MWLSVKNMVYLFLLIIKSITNGVFLLSAKAALEFAGCSVFSNIGEIYHLSFYFKFPPPKKMRKKADQKAFLYTHTRTKKQQQSTYMI